MPPSSKDVRRWVKSWGSGKSRSRKAKKSRQSKDKSTYALVIKIMKGANYSGAEDVEVVALYNESCQYNYISAKFGLKLGIISDADTDGDVELVWACERLGRYHQRSVFWIAKQAGFDLLFGQEKESNVLESQDTQFRCGIQSGVLSKSFSKSFQKGIKNDWLWRLQRSIFDSDSEKVPEMPSLADIQDQLAKELDSTPSRKLRHENRKASNVSDLSHPFWLETPPCHNCESTTVVKSSDTDADGNRGLWSGSHEEDPAASMVFVFKSRPQIDRPTALPTCKGTKRAHPDHNLLPRNMVEEDPRSSKVRNIRRSPSTMNILPSDVLASEESPCRDEGFPPNPSECPCAVIRDSSNEDHGSIVPNSNFTANSSIKHKSVGDSLSAVEAVLLSGMVRDEHPHEKGALSDSSSISLSTGSNSPLTSEISSHNGPSKDYGKTPRPKNITRSGTADLTACDDWADKNFNEYWTRDEMVGNWYHLDENTGTKTWYEAPPWSTSSPT